MGKKNLYYTFAERDEDWYLVLRVDVLLCRVEASRRGIGSTDKVRLCVLCVEYWGSATKSKFRRSWNAKMLMYRKSTGVRHVIPVFIWYINIFYSFCDSRTMEDREATSSTRTLQTEFYSEKEEQKIPNRNHNGIASRDARLIHCSRE